MRDFGWNLLPAAVISRCIFKKQDFNMPRPLHNLSLIDLDVRTSKCFISFEKRLIFYRKWESTFATILNMQLMHCNIKIKQLSSLVLI